jgi:cellulose synthase/poly-beta-1,6-N-acetylglucosamine synthase-like glycosyltransferase
MATLLMLFPYNNKYLFYANAYFLIKFFIFALQNKLSMIQKFYNLAQERVGVSPITPIYLMLFCSTLGSIKYYRYAEQHHSIFQKQIRLNFIRRNSR